VWNGIALDLYHGRLVLTRFSKIAGDRLSDPRGFRRHVLQMTKTATIPAASAVFWREHTLSK
jgi:hypothetical protein